MHSPNFAKHHFFYSLADVQREFKNKLLLTALKQYDFLKFSFWGDRICAISFVKHSVLQMEAEQSFAPPFYPFQGSSHFAVVSTGTAEQTPQEIHYQNMLNYQKISQQFTAYFRGESSKFALSWHLSGTVTFKKIWQAMSLIPSGQTETYGGLAENLFGSKNYSRVVAFACHKNPLAIVIPCHRVLGSSGKLVGYFYGLDLKKELLNHEKNDKKSNPPTTATIP